MNGVKKYVNRDLVTYSLWNELGSLLTLGGAAASHPNKDLEEYNGKDPNVAMTL